MGDKYKGLFVSPEDFATRLIASAKQAVEKPEDAELKAFIEKHGKLKAIEVLLNSMHNFNEKPKP